MPHPVKNSNLNKAPLNLEENIIELMTLMTNRTNQISPLLNTLIKQLEATEIMNKLLILTKEYKANLDPKKTQILSVVNTLLEKLEAPDPTKNEADRVNAFYEFLDSAPSNREAIEKGGIPSPKNIDILKQDTSIPTSNFLWGIAVIAATLATGILPGLLIVAVVYAATKRHPLELFDSKGEKLEKNLEQLRSTNYASFFNKDTKSQTPENPVEEEHTNRPKND